MSGGKRQEEEEEKKEDKAKYNEKGKKKKKEIIVGENQKISRTRSSRHLYFLSFSKSGPAYLLFSIDESRK